MKRLKGKVALITGGSSGIGRATAQVFAREGARVVVAGRRLKQGEETVQLVRGAGGEAVFVRTDVSKETEVRALVQKAVETFGRIDCAFNNASIEGALAPIIEQTEEDFDHLVNINFKGVWLCMKYELPQMLKQAQGGAIVNTSSILGLIGSAALPIYTATKHAVLGLTRSAALEYATENIRVNAVCPGAIRTQMMERLTGGEPEAEEALLAAHPVGRMGDPEEVAEAVVWLCSEAASFVTGHALAVDGGYLAQ